MAKAEKFSRKVSSWFLVPNPIEKPRLRLFCVPYAGGNATAFHRWGSHFKQDEIFSFQLPGRAFRRKEPCIVDIPEMVEAMAAAIKPHLDVPFVFFGHSMGAILAYELARSLRGKGWPMPAGLIVSARRAPSVGGEESVAASLPDDQFWRLIGQLYGTTRALLDSPELKEMLMPTFRGDFRLLNNWSYSEAPAMSFPVLAVGGTSDPGVTQRDLLAWGDETTGVFTHHLIEGGHMFLQPKEAEVVRLVLSFIDGLKLEPRGL